jgi:hypothetical protein
VLRGLFWLPRLRVTAAHSRSGTTIEALIVFLGAVRSLGAPLRDGNFAWFGRDKVCAEWWGLIDSAGRRDRSFPGHLRGWI